MAYGINNTPAHTVRDVVAGFGITGTKVFCTKQKDGKLEAMPLDPRDPRLPYLADPAFQKALESLRKSKTL